jgi:hypothetical protein
LLKYLQHPILIVDDRVTCAGFTGWPRYKMISSSFRSVRVCTLKTPGRLPSTLAGRPCKTASAIRTS